MNGVCARNKILGLLSMWPWLINHASVIGDHRCEQEVGREGGSELANKPRKKQSISWIVPCYVVVMEWHVGMGDAGASTAYQAWDGLQRCMSSCPSDEDFYFDDGHHKETFLEH